MRNLHINKGEKAQTELYCTRYDVYPPYDLYITYRTLNDHVFINIYIVFHNNLQSATEIHFYLL